MQSGITEAKGMRVTVENSTKTPFVVSEGINVPSRTSTNIGLIEERMKRLPEPYPSNCSESYPAELKKYHNFTDHSKYSSGLCSNLCYVSVAEEYCGCYFPYLEGNIPYSPAGKQYCSMDPDLSNRNLTCLQARLYEIVKGLYVDKCKCNPECYETNYKV